MSNDPDMIEPPTRQYRVTLIGEARETYIVEAASPEEAADTWHTAGWLEGTTAFGMDVESVEVDE